MVAAAAFAYWTSSGEGSGTVKASSGSASFEVSSGLVEGLYPGGSSAVTVKVKDTDASQNEYLTKLEAEVEETSVAECKKEWFEVTPASQEPKVLVAHGETKEYTVNLKMKEEAAVNQNACKGASVTLQVQSLLDAGEADKRRACQGRLMKSQATATASPHATTRKRCARETDSSQKAPADRGHYRDGAELAGSRRLRVLVGRRPSERVGEPGDALGAHDLKRHAGRRNGRTDLVGRHSTRRRDGRILRDSRRWRSRAAAARARALARPPRAAPTPASRSAPTNTRSPRCGAPGRRRAQPNR